VGEEDRENRNRVYTQGERPKAGALGCYPLRLEKEREREREGEAREEARARNGAERERDKRRSFDRENTLSYP